MDITLAHNFGNIGTYNNYMLRENVDKEFAIGDVGNPNDFYLIGLEPKDEACYPRISANLFDANGKNLLTISNNVMVFNPNNCNYFHASKNRILKPPTKYLAEIAWNLPAKVLV